MDADGIHTGLDQILRSRWINYVYIVGVAYDYCVYYTVMDAIYLGYNVTIVKSLTRSINISKEQEISKYLQELGINILN